MQCFNIPKEISKLKTIDFALVLHNHQPVGNKDEIVESVYRRSYLPFLKVLAAHKSIRVNIHYSGFLLEWFESNHGEFIELLRTLVKRQSVEIIGGGYYEPIIATIPDTDAIGQAQLLRKTIRSLFGSSPDGFWTAERAWEPQLPEILEKCDVKYTMLDDDIFAASGILGVDSLHPYLVESRGSCTIIFPMLKNLRFLMPFRPANQTIEFLKEFASTDSPVAVSADDGEKFGAWPDTYDQVYTRGWLDNFFRLVEKNSSWLHTVRLSDRLSKSPPRDRTYLGSSSYPELEEWSIPSPDRIKSTKAHGFWRLFLSKYPESARMYSRMLWTSQLVHKTLAREPAAMRELWKGQCNDAYWHGIFGGLYSPILRRLTYSHLISAQKIAEAQLRVQTPRYQRLSLNGSKEFLLNTKSIGVRLCPEIGGAVAELDHKQSNTNLFDTLARRPESYHSEIKKTTRSVQRSKRTRSIHDAPKNFERALEGLLVYDIRERLSFMDHLFDQAIMPEDYESQTQREEAKLSGEYDCKIVKDSSGILTILSKRALTATGSLVEIVKKVRVPNIEPRIEVDYEVRLIRGNSLSSKMGVEVNIGSLGDNLFINRNLRKKILSNANGLFLIHPQIGLKSTFVVEGPMQSWQFPIRTVSHTESGFESNLQGVCLIFSRNIDLKMNDIYSNRLSLEISRV